VDEAQELRLEVCPRRRRSYVLVGVDVDMAKAFSFLLFFAKMAKAFSFVNCSGLAPYRYRKLSEAWALLCD
jgi:hypothetical protein